MADKSSKQDERDNVYSEEFDALKALYSKTIVLPWKDAPTLDNVAKYEAIASTSDESKSIDELGASIQKSRKKEPKTVEIIERKLPLKKVDPEKNLEDEAEEKPKNLRLRKKRENLFTLAEKIEGPLAFLKDCMRHRIRVKVWTRNRAAIRGYCLGFIVAFDKHWNLALEDVREVWSRKIKRKTIPLGIESVPPKSWKPQLPPPVSSQPSEKGMETCERHVPQLLLRGEHVVFVSVVQPVRGSRVPAEPSSSSTTNKTA